MAQHSSVPLAFEFIAKRREWHVVKLVVAGREDAFREPAPKFLGTDIPIPMIGKPLTEPSNDVLFRVEEDSSYAFLGAGSLYKAAGIEEAAHLDALADLVENGRTVPTGSDELLVSGSSTSGQGRKRPDPWAMRDEFLKLDESATALAAFLNRWGTWGTFSLLIERLSGTRMLKRLTGEEYPQFLHPYTVWRERKTYRDGMLGSSASWLSTRATLGLTHRRAEFPYLGIVAATCRQAIETTITLDHLRKVRSRVCARVDCNNIFPVDSDHGKIYCQQYCGHLVSVRNGRAATKKAAKSLKRKKA